MHRFPAIFAALLLAGCAAETAPRPPPSGNDTPATIPTATPADLGELASAPRPLVEIPDSALEESAASRDPFRPPAALPGPRDGDRPVKSRRFPVEELKLVGLVTRVGTPRAMLVDPRGKGWVVTPGELVGRPERLGAGTSAEVLASWRVDRIRDSSVVLVREDPSGREPAQTRVLSLRQDKPIDAIDD